MREVPSGRVATPLRNSVATAMLLTILGCGGSLPPPPPPPQASCGSIAIDPPKANTVARLTTDISGRAGAGCHEIWLIVRARGAAEYHVQPRVTILADGNWTATATLGDAATAGRVFEVVAVGDPAPPIAPGAVLDNWPKARAISHPILLTKADSRPAQKTETDTDGSPCHVEIIDPPAGPIEAVHRFDMHARVSGCDVDQVWFVLRPTDLSNFYVQPRASLREGNWVSRGYLGRRNKDWGIQVEARAIVNPTTLIAEGDVLGYWPDAAATSEAVLYNKKR